MKKITIILCLLLPFYVFSKTPMNKASKPINLLDNNLSYWYKWIGIPHDSVKGLPAGTHQGNVFSSRGIPLGKNNDPKEVFKVVTLNGEKVLRASGEIFGSLITNNEYENYHLHLKYKWGKTKWLPKLKDPRNMGVVFHCIGKDEDAFWSAFLPGLECEISEKISGSLFFVRNRNNTMTPFVDIRVGSDGQWDINGTQMQMGLQLGKYMKQSANFESDSTQWTSMDIYTVGGTAVYLVNGHVVMAYQDAMMQYPDKTIVPLTKGKISLQSEGGEGYYKDISIQSIKAIPAKIQAAAGLAIPRTWKFAVQAYGFRKSSLMETLNKLDTAGIKYLEIFPSQKVRGEFGDSSVMKLSASGLEKLNLHLLKAGFKISSVYINGGKDVASWKKQFEMAKHLHARFVTAEPPTNLLDQIDSLAGAYGIKVAIHNHFIGQSEYWNPDLMLAALKNHPNFGVCPDVGHWPKSGIEPVAALRKLEGHIIALHVKDIAENNNTKILDVTLGKGVIDFPGIFKELQRQKFNGYFILDRDAYDSPSNLPSVMESVKYYNSVLGLK